VYGTERTPVAQTRRKTGSGRAPEPRKVCLP